MQIGTINLYDPDIHHIPENNYQKFQRCLILDSGIGSTVADILKRADNIAIHSANDRKEDLANELSNLKLALYSGIEGISYDTMSFACLVKDVDGVVYPIKTDEDIRRLSEIIKETDISHEEIENYISEVKKKLIFN
jgi:3-dehydroquinate synthase class II